MTAPVAVHFAGQSAVILHHGAEVQTRIAERLRILGVTATGRWPELRADDAGADFAIVDVDRGHDAQFPWERGDAPMPLLALIGSESPGRLAWALEAGMDGFLPLSALANLYSALVVARAHFDARRGQAAQEAETARRTGLRLDVIRAVLQIMETDRVDEAAALKRLRALAMVERVALEDAARLYLDERPDAAGGSA